MFWKNKNVLCIRSYRKQKQSEKKKNKKRVKTHYLSPALVVGNKIRFIKVCVHFSWIIVWFHSVGIKIHSHNKVKYANPIKDHFFISLFSSFICFFNANGVQRYSVESDGFSHQQHFLLHLLWRLSLRDNTHKTSLLHIYSCPLLFPLCCFSLYFGNLAVTNKQPMCLVCVISFQVWIFLEFGF